MPRALVLVALLVGLAACKSTGGTGLTGERLAPQVREASANVITEAEIKAQSFKNAWQAIIALRPTWPKIDGYVNRRRMQYERFQEVPADSVREIRLLSREQARVQFGPEAQQLIHVITK